MNNIDWYIARRDSSGTVTNVADGYATREEAEEAALERNRVHGMDAYFTVVHRFSGGLVDMSMWTVGWRNLTSRRKWKPRSERLDYA